MSRIRNKGTKPEIMLRKALFARGFRYRVNVKSLPGKPDIVLPAKNGADCYSKNGDAVTVLTWQS